MNLFDLSGKVALITGSTKGIGRAAAERMAEHGARVVISSRNAAECAEVARDVERRHGSGRALARAADVAVNADVKGLVDHTLERWGRIDILVANASLVSAGTIEQAPVEDFELAFHGIVSQSVLLAKLAAEPMKAQGGGSVVFLSSSAATAVLPDFPAYGIAKASLHQLARILAVHWGPHNIRVNTIVPGVTRTDSTRGMWEDAKSLKIAVGTTPLARIGDADEIAAGIVFLASPGGAFVTGHTLLIDGGIALRGSEGIGALLAGGAAAG